MDTSLQDTARSKMWASLTPGYAEADKNKKKKLRAAYANALSMMPHEINTREEMNTPTDAQESAFQDRMFYFPNPPVVSLDTWSFGMNYATPSVQTKAQPKDNKMCYECDDFEIEGKFDLAKVQYKRLSARLKTIYSEKIAELRRVYFLDEQDKPATIEELIERLTKGAFTFDKDEFDMYKMYGYSIWKYITWRDPKNELDQDGFDKAVEKLNADYEAARDEITFAPTLDILSKFQAKKFH
jgi:hypothetical protein